MDVALTILAMCLFVLFLGSPVGRFLLWLAVASLVVWLAASILIWGATL